MTFNYAVEKRKFEKVWAKLAKTYAEAGMEPEAIKAMYGIQKRKAFVSVGRGIEGI